MPVSVSASSSGDEVEQPLPRLPFPPISKSHILRCSFHYWHPKYRSVTPKARLIPLNEAFVDYLKADGIFLPPENCNSQWSGSDSGMFQTQDASQNEEDPEEESQDPSADWEDIHKSIKSTIEELGGKVVPKLNWSAPKDATWINTTNSMECRSPNDIYSLLKASDFITHDLDLAFSDCTYAGSGDDNPRIPYHLVLRKYVQINPAVEFRCFVRRRQLVGACQRDLNYFEFLIPMRAELMKKMQKFFYERLHSFPDENFVFDVYIPAPHQRVWLIDINPWAPRTDSILFSWLELLTMPDPGPIMLDLADRDIKQLSLNMSDTHMEYGDNFCSQSINALPNDTEDRRQAELRLIKCDDPEAYNFNTSQYSAHKLPKDVVDASQSGLGGLREFADQWKEIFVQSGNR